MKNSGPTILILGMIAIASAWALRGVQINEDRFNIDIPASVTEMNEKVSRHCLSTLNTNSNQRAVQYVDCMALNYEAIKQRIIVE